MRRLGLFLAAALVASPALAQSELVCLAHPGAAGPACGMISDNSADEMSFTGWYVLGSGMGDMLLAPAGACLDDAKAWADQVAAGGAPMTHFNCFFEGA